MDEMRILVLTFALVLVAAASAEAAPGWANCAPRTYVADGERYPSASATPVLLLADVEVRGSSCARARVGLDRLAAAVPRDDDNAPRVGRRTLRLTSRALACVVVREHPPGEAPRGTIRIVVDGRTAVRARLAG